MVYADSSCGQKLANVILCCAPLCSGQKSLVSRRPGGFWPGAALTGWLHL